MDFKKIIVIAFLFIALLGIATAIVSTIRPEMHKMVIFEQIIFKRGTK